jgi:hypothetical protein
LDEIGVDRRTLDSVYRSFGLFTACNSPLFILCPWQSAVGHVGALASGGNIHRLYFLLSDCGNFAAAPAGQGGQLAPTTVTPCRARNGRLRCVLWRDRRDFLNPMKSR